MFKTVKSLASRWISNRHKRRLDIEISRADTYRLEQEAIEERRKARREADRKRMEFLNCKRLGEMAMMFGAAAESDVGHLQDVMRTLVVVDMQPHWLKGYSERERKLLVDAVAEQIVQARALEWPIIFVEFLPTRIYGDTLPELYSLVDGYEPRYRQVGKYQRSGAGEVLRACEYAGFDTSAFQVCGIYADQCVYDTVRDISLNPHGQSSSAWCPLHAAAGPRSTAAITSTTGIGFSGPRKHRPGVRTDRLHRPWATRSRACSRRPLNRLTANPEHLAPSAPQLICP